MRQVTYLSSYKEAKKTLALLASLREIFILIGAPLRMTSASLTGRRAHGKGCFGANGLSKNGELW